MSGIAPRRSNAAFDPLVNPGSFSGASTSPESDDPLSGSGASVSSATVVLRSLSLAQEAAEVPAQSMSEFLGLTGSDAAAAAADIFGEKSKRANSLFEDDSDEEDEAARQRAEKRQAAAAEAAAAKAKAAVAATPVAREVEVAASRPAHLQARAPAAATTDLFADDGDDDNAGAGAEAAAARLQGVFIPKDAAEYHTAESRHQGEEVDQRLLAEPDDDELDQFLAKPASAAVAPASGVAAASIASAASASASVDDDLDDDLFSSFGASSSTAAVDPAAVDFDFSSYIKNQSSNTDASAGKGASLFDDE